MNQGRIWCVVKPTVGLPLLLGSVTLIALAVHASVLTNTTWMKDYWQGRARVKAALDTTTAPAALAASKPGFVISVTPASVDASGGSAFVVKVTPTIEPATTEAAVQTPALEPPTTLALQSTDSR